MILKQILIKYKKQFNKIVSIFNKMNKYRSLPLYNIIDKISNLIDDSSEITESTIFDILLHNKNENRFTSFVSYSIEDLIKDLTFFESIIEKDNYSILFRIK